MARTLTFPRLSETKGFFRPKHYLFFSKNGQRGNVTNLTVPPNAQSTRYYSGQFTGNSEGHVKVCL